MELGLVIMHNNQGKQVYMSEHLGQTKRAAEAAS